jgi:hypothetical protein
MIGKRPITYALYENASVRMSRIFTFDRSFLHGQRLCTISGTSHRNSETT